MFHQISRLGNTEGEREREMKLFQFLKSTSGAVHEEQPQPERKTEGGVCTSLTVWRKSLIMSCNGFTVIDSTGNLAYRVDNYSGRPVEVTLMDASGKPILTMRRPKVNITSPILNHTNHAPDSQVEVSNLRLSLYFWILTRIAGYY